MKKAFLLPLILVLLTIACDSEDVNPDSLIGTWRLSQTLADPGDGSGVFRPATTEEFINIAIDGSYHSSFSLCQFGNNGEVNTGSIDTLQQVFIPENCSWGDSPAMLPYQLQNGELTISFQCIEACAHLYVKVSNLEQ